MPELELRTLPVLPLKNSVLFPGLMMPLSVGRSASIAAVEAALETEEKEIIIVAQRDTQVETPASADLFTIGVRAVIRTSTSGLSSKKRCRRGTSQRDANDGATLTVSRPLSGRGFIRLTASASTPKPWLTRPITSVVMKRAIASSTSRTPAATPS